LSVGALFRIFCLSKGSSSISTGPFAVLSDDRALLIVYRALLSDDRALLSVYRALLSINMALLSNAKRGSFGPPLRGFGGCLSLLLRLEFLFGFYFTVSSKQRGNIRVCLVGRIYRSYQFVDSWSLSIYPDTISICSLINSTCKRDL